MSLGTGALNVGRGPEHFRPRQGGIHGNPVSGNHPEYTNSKVLGERRYPHTQGGAMGTSEYPQTNPSTTGRHGRQLHLATFIIIIIFICGSSSSSTMGVDLREGGRECAPPSLR